MQTTDMPRDWITVLSLWIENIQDIKTPKELRIKFQENRGEDILKMLKDYSRPLIEIPDVVSENTYNSLRELVYDETEFGRDYAGALHNRDIDHKSFDSAREMVEVVSELTELWRPVLIDYIERALNF